jgi:hypothetical protein
MPVTRSASRAEVETMIDYLSAESLGLRDAEPAELQKFYEELRLDMTYEERERSVEVTIRPTRRDNKCDRGGHESPEW